jgi:uncharacterized protein
MKECRGPFPLQALRRFLPEYRYAGRLLLSNLERRTNMSNDKKKAVEQLLAPMLKKTLFVAINRVVAPASAIEPFVTEHLAYMNGLEAEGRLWASGPFIEGGVLVGDGLTILSTSTIEEARQAMEEEPLVKRGLRSFEIRKWELREGRIDISLRASVSRYSL